MTTEQVVRSTIATLAHRPEGEVRLDTRLADLGLRSMQRVELAVSLEEHLGRKVADATVMRARTVGELVTALTTN